jgi:hypothetical protein
MIVIPPENGENPHFGLQMERNSKNVTEVLGVFEVARFERREIHFAAVSTTKSELGNPNQR